jgi:hypothetical protein
MRKKASVDDIKARALDALQQGIPPEHVGQQFMMQMSMEDPSFARGPSMGQIMQSMATKETLETAISGIASAQVAPPTGIAPNLPTTPIDTKPPIDEVKPPIDKIIDKPIDEPIDEPIDQIPGDPAPEENTPFEDQEEEKNPFDEVGEEQGLQSFQDRLMEDMEEVTEIDPDAPKKKADPQIMEPFLIPEKRVQEMHEELQVINAMLRKVHLPPIDMVPTSDDLVTRTVHYSNGQQEEAFQELKMTGTLPSPTDEMTIKKIKHRTWGRPKYDLPPGTEGRKILHNIGDLKYHPVTGLKVKEKESSEQIGIKLIAQINHHALTEEEQAMYLAQEPADSPLRKSILSALDPEANDGEILTPYYNTITSIGGQYKWQDKFYFTRGEDCYKCQVGQHRNTTYVGIVVKPDQLNQRTYPGIDENGQESQIGMTIRRDNPAYNSKLPESEENQRYVDVPALEINEDSLKLPYQQQVQEQIGGKCATNLDEIKVVEKLKRLIGRMSLTSQEVEENNAKNVRKGKKDEKDNADLIGGTRGSTPINNYYAVLIALLRENGMDKDISGQIPRSVGALLRLKAYQKQGPQTPEVMAKMEELTAQLPTITPEDTQLARVARGWWVKRMGGAGNSDMDKNVINMSVPSTINVSRNEVGKGNIDNSIYMMRTFLKENEFKLKPHAEGTQTELGYDISEEIKPEEVAPEQEILDNMRRIPEGGTFVSKFTHISSAPYRGGHGMLHHLRGDDGKKYKVFDAFKKDPISNQLIREPKYNFNDGEEYTLRGRKGSFSNGATALGNIAIITPERLGDHVGAEEASVDEGIIDTPVDTPVDKGIGAPPEAKVEPPAKPESLDNVTKRAIWVVENGRDTRGNPMTVETLIPLYLNQLAARVEGLEATKDNYAVKLNEINQRGGPPAVAKYMETLRKHFEDYEI